MQRSCAGRFPPGATPRNSFVVVPSVTGACNNVLTANLSVAVDPDSGIACRTPLQLVTTTTGANFGTRRRDDLCDACADHPGTDAHIDNYTSSPACTGHDVGDLGNYWTMRTR